MTNQKTIPEKVKPDNPDFFKYCIIPKPLILDQKIPWSAKALLSLLFTLDEPEKGCYANNDFLAKQLGISIQTITNHLALLKEKKYIKIKNEQSKYRIIKINSTYKKFYGLLIKKLMSPINIYNSYSELHDTDKRKKDIFLSNDSGESEESKKSKVIRNVLIDEYWNQLPNVSKHHSPNTKTYQQSRRYLLQLKKGIFPKRNHLDNTFLSNNKITQRLLKKKFTNDEIKIGMERLSHLLTGGYWPADKSNLPKSLEILLYNSRKNNSLFLMVMNKEPKLLKDDKQIVMEDPNPDLTKEFLPLFNGAKIDYGRLHNGIRSILDFYNEIPEDDYGKNEYYFGYPWKLCKAYVDWLLEQDWIGEIKVQHISAETKTWIMFIKETEENLGLELTS